MIRQKSGFDAAVAAANAKRLVRLWRKGHGYLHMSGKGYSGAPEWAWSGFRYQARNILKTLTEEERAEMVIRWKNTDEVIEEGLR